jgi:membrane protein
MQRATLPLDGLVLGDRWYQGAMRLLERARANRVLGTALSTHQRVNEIGGGFLASALTLTLFLSLFPLLLVGIAVVGLVASGDAGLGSRLVGNLGLEGDAADLLLDGLESAKDHRASSSVVGLVGFLWTAIGLVGTVQQICNRTWQVPGRGLEGKLVAAGWLLGSFLVLGVAIGAGGLFPGLPAWATPLESLVGLATGTAFFLWTFKVLTAKDLPLRTHLPGAVLGGVGLHLLTRLGGFIVGRQIESGSALYGSIGVVFALLAYLLLLGRLLVYAAALNVVLHERGHGVAHVEVAVPRFDGEVPLEGDRSGQVTRTA